jgi:hypothetical protein
LELFDLRERDFDGEHRRIDLRILVLVGLGG